jgi:hypothetical protein
VLPRALRARDPEPVRAFEAGFERVGIPALGLQVATGLWLAFHWVPDVGSWFRAATPPAEPPAPGAETTNRAPDGGKASGPTKLQGAAR